MNICKYPSSMNIGAGVQCTCVYYHGQDAQDVAVQHFSLCSEY